MDIIRPENRKLFAFTRSYEGETVLCIYNLSPSAQPVLLDLPVYEGATPVEMIGETEFPRIEGRSYQLALGPYGFYWFLLNKG
jgi:maltose alpha-D-glucosyltransferase/alpha-amylase